MKALAYCTAAVLALLSACAPANAQPLPLAGRDYLRLDPPRATASAGSIEVIEFFYYGCPVCYEAQEHVMRWRARAAADVSQLRIPSAASENQENFARTYYALEAHGQLERLHWTVYENYHFDDQRLLDEESLLAWLARNGIDAEAFRRLRDSPEVRARVAAGRAVFDAYGVRAVPTFVIDGRFLTSARLAGGVKEMMDVVEYLVGRAREERRSR